MDNQDMQENQVKIVNGSEKNPRLVSFEELDSFEEQKGQERNFSDKERQESSSNFISKLPSKSKRKRRKR